MRTDHHAVLERLEPIEASAERIASGAARSADETGMREFVAHLEAQFATHMRAEDEVIYPALESALPDTRGSLAPLRTEHQELRDMLASLRAMLDEPAGAARNEQIAVQAKDLADLLRIHIRKEEAIVFAVAERLMRPGELSALGARLATLASPGTIHTARPPRASKEG
jgi:hemerythrin-like domain-containing protein